MSIVTKGNVSVQVHGLLKHKPLPGSYGVLFDRNKDQPPRIELYEQANQPSSLHVIRLQQLKFSSKTIQNDENFFVLSVKKEKYHFLFDTMDDKEEWINSLCYISSELCNQRASAKEISDADDADASKGMEENLLYDSSDRVQQFKVSVVPTRASESNGLKGHFLLNPGYENLSLLDIATFKSIHDWPYRLIRKYGRSHNIFRMEVGRRCTTGAGEFEFFTPDGELLTYLIGKYTNAVREKDSKQQQDEIPHSSPQHSPVAQAPLRGSGSYRDTSDREPTDVMPVRSSSVSLTGKPDFPRPAPRSKFASTSKQENSAKEMKKEPSTSSDTKIYETSSGLTAPLESDLKEELSSKLQISVPAIAERAQSLDSLEEKYDARPPSECAESDAERRISTSSLKDKKKTDKEKKRLEKEQKKHEKEEKERLAREQKEREKQQKKESKNHKLTRKKSNMPVPVLSALAHGGNIYDEPEELLTAAKTKVPVKPLDFTYDEAGYAEASYNKRKFGTEDEPKPASLPEGDMYATPEKPKKDGWKKHAIKESEDIHQEDYTSIKMASMSQTSSLPPSSFNLFPRPNPTADDSDDIYNHLSYVPKPQILQTPENVYGMASAVQTIKHDKVLPDSRFVVGTEYEDAEDVNPQLHPSYTYTSEGNEYEITDVPPLQRHEIISNPDTGEYADIK